MSNNGSSPLVLWYNQLGMNDVDRVGGKNASLGEMITNLSGMGVSVPNGFATTADAFNQFLDQSGVNQRIYELLDKTDIDDVTELAKAGAQIRQWIIDTPFQPELENAVRDAYAQLSADDAHASFAVRSSATAEDMPDASFAGQQETFLNVVGERGEAVIVKAERTSSTLNEQYIWRYEGVLRTAEGRDVEVVFHTNTASLWPLENAIRIPAQDQPFVVKYTPGFPRNFVILTNESPHGIAQARARQTPEQKLDAVHVLQAQGRTLLIASHDPALIAAMDRELRL